MSKSAVMTSPPPYAFSSNAVTAESKVIDLGPRGTISTGICFLDHMVDQLTSHAQLGVTLRVSIAVPLAAGEGAAKMPRTMRHTTPQRDYAAGSTTRPHDRDIFIACGAALGGALHRVVEAAAAVAAGRMRTGGALHGRATFCSPLDEAITKAVVALRPQAERVGVSSVSLEPYGMFASGSAGRRWIGRFRTELTPLFWSALTTHLGGELSLHRVRGTNAHHVLESAFKAFARAFRSALDSIMDGKPHGCLEASSRLGLREAPVAAQIAATPGAPAHRRAQRRRATKETTIEVRFGLLPYHLDTAPPASSLRTSCDPFCPVRLYYTMPPSLCYKAVPTCPGLC